jgi:hypothetical protein
MFRISGFSNVHVRPQFLPWEPSGLILLLSNKTSPALALVSAAARYLGPRLYR